MRRLLLCALFVSGPLAAQTETLDPTPAAVQLFERDWLLRDWALRFYDRDRDVILSPEEAKLAASEFKKIADSDGDGRVTTQEFAAAKDFILARY